VTNFFGRALRVILPVVLATVIGNAWAQLPDVSASSDIRIVSPRDGEVFKAPARIMVKVTGSDVPNVGHVLRLYEEGTLLHVLVLDPLVPITTNHVPFMFDFDWTDIRAGRYTLTAMIDDVSSAPVHIVVKRRH
jgi:hypothetical protein